MSDYNAPNYKPHGGAEQVIGSSGYLTVNGYIDVNSSGYINVDDGGYIKVPSATETTAANLSNFGISYCASTGTKELYKIDAPAAGRVKHILFSVAAATGFVNVSSTGAKFQGKGVTAVSYLKAVGDGGVTLAAYGTGNWYVVGKSTTVSLTTSTT